VSGTSRMSDVGACTAPVKRGPTGSRGMKRRRVRRVGRKQATRAPQSGEIHFLHPP